MWRCSANPTEHTAIPNIELIQKVGNVLAATLQTHLTRRQNDTLTLDRVHIAQDEIAELKRQRQRLEDAYLRGLFSVETFERRVLAIDEQISTANQKSATAEIKAANREAWLKSIHASLGQNAHVIPKWLTTRDPVEVNHILRLLIDSIIVTRRDEDHIVEIRYKPD